MGYRIAVLGYRVPFIPNWDPDSVKTGLPGSEECAVYASQELINRGHIVDVYMSPPEDTKYSNWFPIEYWMSSDNDRKYDFVLMWRNLEVALAKKRGKYAILWAHDSPPPNVASLPAFPKMDGAFLLSEHHNRQMSAWPRFNQTPCKIIGNGYLTEHFPTPCRASNPLSIGYFSNYARGLLILVLYWPTIRKEFPTATLSICYGRETWNTMNPDAFNLLISKIEEYKDQGITEHGKIGHQALAEVMENTSIWAYPCITTAETFCITAVKAQAAGCIPLTTRIGALNETIHPEAPHSIDLRNDNDIGEYIKVLLTNMRRIQNEDPDKILIERQKYIRFAENFTWKKCIDKWEEFFSYLISPM